MRVEFRLLGNVELYQNGWAAPLGPAKRRAMLAALLLQGNQLVSLDRLAAALWAGPSPRSAVANLRTHAAALRRFLGDRIVAFAGGYRLRVEPGELDADKFTRLAELGQVALGAGDASDAVAHLAAALELWRGEAAGEGLARGTALDVYLAGLDEQRLRVFEDLVEARLSLGEHGHVLPTLRQHLARQPLRERAWSQLMLALYRAGDPAAALNAYHEAREALDEHLGVEPGPELVGLQRAILDRDPQLSPPVVSPLAAGPARREVPSHISPPRQLPADAVDLVGRTTELAALMAAVRAAARDGPATVLVSGPGGVGKSALAVRAAHMLAGDFPDGQVFIDLRGLPPTAPAGTPDEATACALRALGVPAVELPSRLDERAGWYRTRLSGARVLVLLDNATSAAQVRPLVPAGSGSVLLVTSRHRLSTVDAMRRLPVDPLPDDDARTLFVGLVGRARVNTDPDSAARLVRLCAGLPLALRIAGLRLASSPGWPLALLARQLSDEGQRLDALAYEDLSVRDRFATGYRAVGADDELATRAFRLLGALPDAEVTPEVVAEHLRAPVDWAWRSLERLVDAQLLSAPAPGRYRLPDLVRQYAAELAAASLPFGIEAAAATRAASTPFGGGSVPAVVPRPAAAMPAKYADGISASMSVAYRASHASSNGEQLAWARSGEAG